MALIKFKECEKEVSTEAEKCPNCGAPIKKKGIGYLSLIALFIVFIVFVIVLGSVLNASKKSTSSNKPQKVSQNKEGISTSDFDILSFSPQWEDERLRAIGELKNNGKIAAGAQVEVIARDANGQLVASVIFWPNSINNILPGGTCGIAYTITEDRKAKKAEIKVISVKTWEKR
jgi:hypothetical protein